MSKKKGGFMEYFYEKIAPKATGIGAAIVIIGALFKIQHYPGASIILNIGMIAEAILFLMFAFAPQHKDPEWSRVYPELADDYVGDAPKRNIQQGNDSVAKQLDGMLASANIGPELVNSLGKGMQNLSTSVTKLSSLGGVVDATNGYANAVKQASVQMTEVNKAYGNTVKTMNEAASNSQQAVTQIISASKSASESMAAVANNTQAYQGQVQTVTKNLTALNAVYEMELKDSKDHIQAMNKFYGNISNAMSNMADAAKESEQFKGEINKLTNNLNSLNKVYGSMLTAMKG
ncbi:gliding motility protein GldL [Persicobacter psychrovividus]|uniref:Gliding motility protein GldL-like N-terminal domain-containing protein n=1 Tax=Persicobacter psychrovividus TaxID=387638 RepID=A0ABN6LBN2_9BACT|nr:hypothetical protein PEPS_25140 [Persicobacter psychrovividus]